MNKTKSILSMGLVMAGLSLSAFTLLDQPANFSGSWLLNTQQSQGPEGTVPNVGKSMIRVIQQQPSLILEKSITDSTGKAHSMLDTVAFGKAKTFDVGNGQKIEKTMSQQWSADKKIMTLAAQYKLQQEGESLEFNGTETWKLSADGKVLTIVSETVLPDRTDVVTLIYNKI